MFLSEPQWVSARRAGGFFVLSLVAALANAATIQVAPSLVDIEDDGQCSLIEAIDNANANSSVNRPAVDFVLTGELRSHDDCAAGDSSGTDIIELSEGPYVISQPDNYWYGPNGLPLIQSDIEIVGHANGSEIRRKIDVDQDNNDLVENFRLFAISSEITPAPPNGFQSLPRGSLTLRNLLISNGFARGGRGGNGGSPGGGGAGLGGAIFNRGDLLLESVTGASNRAHGGSGGGDGLRHAEEPNGGGGGLGGNGGVSCGGGGGFGGHGGDGRISNFQTGSTTPLYNGGGGAGFRLADQGQDATADYAGGGGGANPGQPVAGFGSGGNGATADGSSLGSDGGFGGGGGACRGTQANDGGFGGGGGAPQINEIGGAGGFGGGGGGRGPGGFGGGGGGEASLTTSPTPGGFGGGEGSGSAFFDEEDGGIGGSGAGFGGFLFADIDSNNTIVNSTLSNNSARRGILLIEVPANPFDSNSEMILVERTPSPSIELAKGYGGAIFSYQANVEIIHTTFSGNRAQRGGALFAYQNAANGVAISNSILANSIDFEDEVATDCDSEESDNINYIGVNLVRSSNSCDNPQLTSDPQLSDLSDNGGPTPTQVPASTSVLDAADPSVCQSINAGNPVDQRGEPRPFSQACDLGSVELQCIERSTGPVFNSSPNTQQVIVGSEYQYAVEAGDCMPSLRLAAGPDWLDLSGNGDGTGLLTGAPATGDIGDHTVRLEAVDSRNRGVSQQFQLSVIAAVSQSSVQSTDSQTVAANGAELVSVGRFELRNDGNTTDNISALTINVSNPNLIDRMTLEANGRTFLVRPVSESNIISISPAIELPANSSIEFTVKAASEPISPSVASFLVQPAYASAADLNSRYSGGLALVMTALGLFLFYRRHAAQKLQTRFVGVILAGALLTACGGGSSSPSSNPSSGQSTSQIAEFRLLTVTAINERGDPNQYGGLPLAIGQLKVAD